MGTTFRIVLYAENAQLAKEASDAAFKRIDELNAIFSDYLEDSEASKLSIQSGSGLKQKVSPEMQEVLNLAREISKRSKGAFDVTVGPLSKLWRRAIRRKEFPGVKNINDARSKVNYRWIKLYGKSQEVLLKKKGMQLDFGGIAKGYAIDEAYQILISFGIDRALIEGGGDVYVGAPPPAKKGWSLAFLADSSDDNEITEYANKALASSGDTYQYLEWEGVRYSHIVDPRTGFGVTGNDVINVIAPKCVMADVIASTVSVMGVSKAKKLMKRYKGVDLR